MDAATLAIYETLWLDSFATVTAGRLEAAFRKTIRACKFFPKVADVWEHLDAAQGAAKDEVAERAWQRLLDYIREWIHPDISFSGRPQLNEQIDRAARAAGGLGYLRECSTDALVWAKKEFLAAYQRFDELDESQFLLPDGEMKNLIAAVAETKSVGRVLEAPRERPPVPKPPASLSSKPIPTAVAESSHFVDVEGRRKLLAAQAEEILRKYPPSRAGGPQ